MPPWSEDPSMWRLQAARVLAWALLLCGWVGLGSLSQTLAPGPFCAFSLLALWLLALGACATLIGRARWARRGLCGALACAAVLIGSALPAALHGGGLPALLAALLGWAMLVALASATVRACRSAARTRPGPPVAAAAGGAALAWACVGDLGDLNALGARLTLTALAACLLLAVLLPRHVPAAPACRAGLFDCSLPDGSMTNWRLPQRWPLGLATFAMLPMMCSLPLMASLCRADAVSPQLVLGLHFAAMFGPALAMLWRPALAAAASGACAVLLASGTLALLFAPGASAWWGLALAHGSAWSIAWAVRLNDRPGRAGARASPLAGAALNAALVLILGAAIAVAGLQALADVHVVLGVLATLAAMAAPVSARWRRVPG